MVKCHFCKHSRQRPAVFQTLPFIAILFLDILWGFWSGRVWKHLSEASWGTIFQLWRLEDKTLKYFASSFPAAWYSTLRNLFSDIFFNCIQLLCYYIVTFCTDVPRNMEYFTKYGIPFGVHIRFDEQIWQFSVQLKIPVNAS